MTVKKGSASSGTAESEKSESHPLPQELEAFGRRPAELRDEQARFDN
jgi:hypothetical protein